jgi:hypothetical protein
MLQKLKCYLPEKLGTTQTSKSDELSEPRGIFCPTVDCSEFELE